MPLVIALEHVLCVELGSLVYAKRHRRNTVIVSVFVYEIQSESAQFRDLLLRWPGCLYCLNSVHRRSAVIHSILAEFCRLSASIGFALTRSTIDRQSD